MYWQEDNAAADFKADDEVVDVVLKLKCRSLPVDHNYALYDAIAARLPWVTDARQVAIANIHISESANGWERPDAGDSMYISQRTKLSLRMPKDRVADFKSILGEVLDIDGHELVLEKIVNQKLLVPSATLYSHYVVAETEHEDEFMEQCAQQITGLGIKIKKMLSGKVRKIRYKDHFLLTRSLMLADLSKEESVVLQKQGVGHYQKMGCGIFIPYKGIKAVDGSEEKE